MVDHSWSPALWLGPGLHAPCRLCRLLYERCPKAVEPLWVEGAGHNDIELYSQYLERLRRFISQELPSQRA